MQGNWPEDVELLLDAQRPQVQKRLYVVVGVEVAHFLPRLDVRQEGERRYEAFAEIPQLVREKQRITNQDSRAEHHKKRGQEPSHATLVEFQVGEVPRLEFALDDAADEEARNDEEHVNAHEPAGEEGWEGVEEENHRDGDGAQTVDVGTVGDLFCGRGCRPGMEVGASGNPVHRGALATESYASNAAARVAQTKIRIIVKLNFLALTTGTCGVPERSRLMHRLPELAWKIVGVSKLPDGRTGCHQDAARRTFGSGFSAYLNSRFMSLPFALRGRGAVRSVKVSGTL